MAVVIFVTISVLGLGLFFVVSEAISSDVRKYQISYKTDSESDFEYAKNTKVGNVLAEGFFRCDNPVSDSRIDGVYSSIRIDMDYYTTHTTTTVDSKGTTHVSIYYSWDWVSTDYNRAETFSFLGQTGSVSDLDGLYSPEETIYDGSIRYRIYTIPTSFYGVGFWSSSDDFRLIEAWRDTTVDRVLNEKLSGISVIPNAFFIVWEIIAITITGLFIYRENNWLLFKKEK